MRLSEARGFQIRLCKLVFFTQLFNAMELYFAFHSFNNLHTQFQSLHLFFNMLSLIGKLNLIFVVSLHWITQKNDIAIMENRAGKRYKNCGLFSQRL